MTDTNMFPKYDEAFERVKSNMLSLIDEFGKTYDIEKNTSDSWTETKTEEALKNLFDPIEKINSESAEKDVSQAGKRYDILLRLDLRLEAVREQVQKGNVGAFSGATSVFTDLVEDFYGSESTGWIYDLTGKLFKPLSDVLGDINSAIKILNANIDAIPEDKRGLFHKFEEKVGILDSWVKITNGAVSMTVALSEGDIDSGVAEAIKLGLTIGTESVKSVGKVSKFIDNPDVAIAVDGLERFANALIDEHIFNAEWEEKVENALDMARGITLDDTQLAISYAFERGMSREHAQSIAEGWDQDNLAPAYRAAAGENDGSTAGDDIIVFGAGDQEVEDRAGNDEYGGGHGLDAISFAGRGAVEIVNGVVTRASGEVDRFSRFEKIETSDQADRIDMSASTADLEILAGDGDDTIITGDGDDTLVGGAGADSMSGGWGADRFIADLEDTVDGGGHFHAPDNVDILDLAEVADDVRLDVSSLEIKGGKKGGAFDPTLTAWAIEEIQLGGGADDVQLQDMVRISLKTGDGDDIVKAGRADLKFDGEDGVDTLSFAGLNDDLRFSIGGTVAGATGVGFYAHVAGGGYAQSWMSSADRIEVIEGGLGNDTFDVASDLATGCLDGGDGQNAIRFFADEQGEVCDLAGLTLEGDIATLLHTGATYELKNIQVINGSSGSDILEAGSSTTSINAGSGDDTVRSGVTLAAFDGGEGKDTIDFTKLSQGVSLDFESWLYADNDYYARALVAGEKAGERFLASDFEVMIGSQFADRIVNHSAIEIDGGAGVDVITGAGHAELLRGGSEGDTIHGGGGADEIDGGSGADDLNGGGGNDTLTGGTDGDTFRFSGRLSGHDTITDFEPGRDVIDFGFDQYGGAIGTTSDVPGGVRISITHNGREDASVTLLGVTRADLLDAGIINEAPQLFGTIYNDFLFGTDRNDSIRGFAGNDVIEAHGGNDWIDGGAGDDTLRGGHGDDRYYWTGQDGVDSYSDVGGYDRIVVDYHSRNSVTLGSDFNSVENGIDRVELNTWRSYWVGLAATQGDDVWDISNLTYGHTAVVRMGAGNDTVKISAALHEVHGGAGDDTIIGSAGGDNIYGGVGNDTLEGGLGDDRYYWSGGEGVDTFRDEGGYDRLIVNYHHRGSLTLGSNFNAIESGLDKIELNTWRTYWMSLNATDESDNWDLTGLEFGHIAIARMGAGDDTITASLGLHEAHGGAGDDTLIGSEGQDRLFGNADTDHLIGNGGHDWLDGGSGDDILEGGIGDDTYFWNSASGIDRYRDAGGRDTLMVDYHSRNAVTLGSEFDSVSNGIDVISLNTWRDYWIGLNGTAGADVWDLSAVEFGHTTVVRMGDGDDQITVSAGLHEAYAGSGHDTMIGSDGNDRLFGQDGADEITANGGHDFLDGGSGDDRLEGGLGDDTYFWSSNSGFDSYLDEGGNDRLLVDYHSRNSVTLGSNFNSVENGIDRVELNTWRTYWVGLAATQGDDVWDISNLTYGHTAVVRMGDGNDTVKISAALHEVHGGAGDDTIIGSAGGDNIYGGVGNDTLEGGLGDDRYYWSGGEGVDTFRDEGGYDRLIVNYHHRGSLTLGSNFNAIESGLDKIELNTWRTYWMSLNATDESDNWDLTGLEFGHIAIARMGEGDDMLKVSSALHEAYGGAGEDTLVGSELHDRLFGDDGEDFLFGDSGNDFLDGGEGWDILEGGLGDDTYFWSGGDGADLYYDVGGQDRLLIDYHHRGSVTLDANFDSTLNGIDHVELNTWRSYWVALDGTGGGDTWDISNLTFGHTAVVRMGEGQDYLKISAGLHEAYGGAHDDTIVGSSGNDRIFGESGDDFIYAGLGSDWIDGGTGVDTLVLDPGFSFVERDRYGSDIYSNGVDRVVARDIEHVIFGEDLIA